MAPDSPSGTGKRDASPGAWAAGEAVSPPPRSAPPGPPPRTSHLADLALALGVTVFGGAFGIVGAIIQQLSAGSLAMVAVVGPAIEEIMKPIALVFLVERAPWRIRSRLQVVLIALAAGLGFSILENLVYIHVYFPAITPRPGPDAELLRWLACTPLHTVCSTIVGLGLARQWARWRRTGERVQIERILPWFAAAVILHGGWNTAAVLLG
jgi:RsiW-degrading membrane proteinase PrsW (M82 family)